MLKRSGIFVFILALMVFAIPSLNDVAVAQEVRSPSILEFFGLKSSKPNSVTKKSTPKSKIKKTSKLQKPVVGRKKTTRKFNPTRPLMDAPLAMDSVIAPIEPTPIPEKLIVSKVVLVVGDFMASGVSEGLIQAFERDAGVVVVSKSNGSSGFIREDFYNWSQEIGAIIAETKPAVITVMLGTNDRQPLRLNGLKAAVRSPEWIAEYEKRVERFATTLKQSGLPVVWIGLPPLRQPGQSADVLAFNDIYRKNAERIAAKFVDIWDGFLDVNGVFDINGFDYIGQPTRLRASDGTNLTSSGKRKVAFFAEKPLRLALGELGIEGTSVFNPFNLPGPKLPAASKLVTITHLPPISLFDPTFDGDTQLLGGGDSSPEANGPKSAAQSLYLDGVAPKPMLGRTASVKVGPLKLPSSQVQADINAEIKTP